MFWPIGSCMVPLDFRGMTAQRGQPLSTIGSFTPVSFALGAERDTCPSYWAWPSRAHSRRSPNLIDDTEEPMCSQQCHAHESVQTYQAPPAHCPRDMRPNPCQSFGLTYLTCSSHLCYNIATRTTWKPYRTESSATSPGSSRSFWRARERSS